MIFLQADLFSLPFVLSISLSISISISLSFCSSSSFFLPAMLSPSFFPVERPPIASQWRRINCAGVLGAPPRERTDGRTDATWGDPLCSFERGFPYRRAKNACARVCVTCARAGVPGARYAHMHRCSGPWDPGLRSWPGVESLGRQIPQDLLAGQGCRVVAGNPIVR